MSDQQIASDAETGISIRLVQKWDIQADQELNRFDVYILGYRWWTWSISRSHVKLGPLALTWYRWGSHWNVEACWLCVHCRLLMGSWDND